MYQIQNIQHFIHEYYIYTVLPKKEEKNSGKYHYIELRSLTHLQLLHFHDKITHALIAVVEIEIVHKLIFANNTLLLAFVDLNDSFPLSIRVDLFF